MSDSALVQARLEHDGALLRVVFGRPPANVIDAAVVGGLCEVVRAHGGALVAAKSAPLRAIVLEGAGDQFSYGASVEEHLPDQVADMLAGFHRLLRALVSVPVTTVALVRGRCLGGGMELAAACDVILADETARFGQPEIVLGVFAPAATALLPARVGQARAADLLLTGRTMKAEEAHAMGLVAQVAPAGELEAHFQGWCERYLLPRSAAALRIATRAVRSPVEEAIGRNLAALETLYLEDLMKTRDAEEGLRAFLDKRPPAWSHA